MEITGLRVFCPLFIYLFSVLSLPIIVCYVVASNGSNTDSYEGNFIKNSNSNLVATLFCGGDLMRPSIKWSIVQKKRRKKKRNQELCYYCLDSVLYQNWKDLEFVTSSITKGYVRFLIPRKDEMTNKNQNRGNSPFRIYMVITCEIVPGLGILTKAARRLPWSCDFPVG